jgi:hypothetical protein
VVSCANDATGAAISAAKSAAAKPFDSQSTQDKCKNRDLLFIIFFPGIGFSLPRDGRTGILQFHFVNLTFRDCTRPLSNRARSISATDSVLKQSDMQ